MEKSTELYLKNTESSAAEALKMVDDYINARDMEKKKALHLRLLAEETIGMVRAMAGDFKALFWLEEDDGEYRVRLTAKTEMDKGKKQDLLSVSKSGKNASAKGFMGKIGEIIENGLLHYSEVMKLQQEYGGGYVDYALIGCDVPEAPVMGEPIVWSLNNYKEGLEQADDSDAPAKEAWDELEKSIVASIAKDVVVGVKKDRVEMTIIAG
jgi:hypothetical protein